MSLDLLSSPFDLDMSALLSYNNTNSAKVPASMGYGWSSIDHVGISFDGSGNLYYRDETSNSLRWNLSGGVYVPYTQDNYVLATYDAVNSWYVLTFKDQSQRIFKSSDLRLYRTLDRNGNYLTYNYNAAGHISTVVDSTPAARTITYGYASPSDPQPQTISGGGRTVHLAYNASNQLSSITSDAGDVTSYTYDPVSGSIATIIDPTGTTAVAYTYDSIGRVLTETSYTNQSVLIYQYGFDAIDLTLATAVSMTLRDLTLASPNQVTVQYFDTNFNITKTRELVDPSSGIVNETNMVYADANNPYLVTQVIDPNLNVTNLTYTAKGNLATYKDAQNHITSYTYAEDVSDPNPKHRNLLVKLTRPTVTVGGTPTNYTPSEWAYDTNGNLQTYTFYIGATSHTVQYVPDLTKGGLVTSVTDANGKITSFGYDASTRNLLTVTLPKETGDPAGASQRVTTFTYTNDNIATIADALTNTVHILTDGDNRTYQVTDPLTNISKMNYVQGLLQSIQLPANQASGTTARFVHNHFDAANRLSYVERDISATVTVRRIAYGYDGYSNVNQQIRQQVAGGAGNVNTYFYDSLGRPIANQDPLGRLTSTVYAPYCKQNQVNTARGIQITSTYDSLCRLTQIASQTELRQFAYDELSRLVSDKNGGRFAWNIDPVTKVGAHFGQSSFAGGRTYEYDSIDRLVKQNFPDGTYIGYQWDPVGNLLQQRDIFGQTTNYAYYDDNRLATVSFTYSGTTYTFTYTYDLAGRPAAITFPAGTNIVLSFTDSSGVAGSGWDANGRLRSMRYLKSGTNIQSFVYSYDNSGNRTGMVENNGTTTVTWAYTYDWLDRLTTVTKNGTLTSTYAYDGSDNRATLVNLSGSYVYNRDSADQLVNKKTAGGTLLESYVHDQDGNMTSRTLASSGNVTSYSWNDFNNLVGFALNGVSQESDSYDTDGIRRNRGDGTKYSTSDGTSLAELRPTSGQVSFIQGHQVLGLQEGGSLYFFLSDALGSVRQVVTSAGASTATFATDEYGVPTASSGSAELLANTYVGALGVRNETGTPTGIAARGLYYMQQRWMDPQLGQFISADPIGFRGGLNKYSYTRNPVNYIDPEGLRGWLIIKSRSSHAWIEYKRDNMPKRTFATWQGGFYINKEIFKGVKATNVRAVRLDNLQEDKLFGFMNAKENRQWSYSANCATFATGAWRAATGQDLDAINFAGIKTPGALNGSLDAGDLMVNVVPNNSISSSGEGGSIYDGSQVDSSLSSSGSSIWTSIYGGNLVSGSSGE